MPKTDIDIGNNVKGVVQNSGTVNQTFIDKVITYPNTENKDLKKEDNRVNLTLMNIVINPFIDILCIENDILDKLIQGNISNIKNDLFVNFDKFIASLLKKNIPIKINNSDINSKIHFYAYLIVLSTIEKSDGNIKWLIKKTIENLSQDYKLSNNILKKVWEIFNEKYIDKDNNLEKILNLTIDTFEKKKKKINATYYFYSFLFEILNDTNINKTITFLEEYKTNHINLKHTFNKLIGKANGFMEKTALPKFNPNMIEIEFDDFPPYYFEVMEHPLTQRDYSIITLEPIEDNHYLLYPYILHGYSFERKIKKIIELCQNKEQNQDYYWDIPTIPEWLVICDCKNKKYPWGNELPDKTYANLHFGNLNNNIKPVKTYEYNKTKKGVYDCCGNIHEIVYFDFNGNFRLMGGCYLNRYDLSSCQIIRRPVYEKEDNENTGIRLIRYHKKFYEIRKNILEEFHKEIKNRKSPKKYRKGFTKKPR